MFLESKLICIEKLGNWESGLTRRVYWEIGKRVNMYPFCRSWRVNMYLNDMYFVRKLICTRLIFLTSGLIRRVYWGIGKLVNMFLESGLICFLGSGLICFWKVG